MIDSYDKDLAAAREILGEYVDLTDAEVSKSADDALNNVWFEGIGADRWSLHAFRRLRGDALLAEGYDA